MLEVHVQMELKRHLVEHLVQLLSCGHVLEVTPETNGGLPTHFTSCSLVHEIMFYDHIWQVVNYMFRCMKTENLDHSLIRHFISEVSNSCSSFDYYIVHVYYKKPCGCILQKACISR